MTSDELIKLIDYYNRSQSSYLSKIVPICAVVVALTSLIASWRWLVRDRETRLRQELYGLWDGLVSDFIQHPDFLDKHVTSKYPNLKDAEARFAYDALCFRAWGLFRRIATSRLKTVPEYNAIAQWIATNLRIWIEFNPVFFPEAQFWQYLQQLIDRPIVDFQLAPLPRMANTKPEDDGTVAERYDLDIDWDTIAKNYHSCILGPFAPTMVDSSHGSMRNLLIDELNKIPENDLAR